MSSTATATGSLILVLGSRNRKKCREMAELIRPPWEPSHRLDRLELGSLDEFPGAPEVDESAETFAGNARKKAAELARALDRWVLADDSGLTVDALQGAPGVLSARYAGEPCDDAANNSSWWRRSPRCPTTAAGPRFAAHWPWPILRARSGSKPKALAAGGSSASRGARQASVMTLSS